MDNQNIKVTNVGSTDAFDSKIGRTNDSKSVWFVEPLENKPVDNKELVIFVDLTATKKNRTVIGVTQGANNVQQASGVKSTTGGKVEINLLGYRQPNGDVKFMSTDWSNKPIMSRNSVGGKTTDFSYESNIFEGFGIESIDINITAMNPPTVNIKFIDTRGGGLFDQETFNSSNSSTYSFQNNNSPYAIFFEMPPPLFYLTVKGYYGQPVRLCLYLIKWQGTFNSETGNFEVNANFLGYTFAFLQDIRIGHLIGAGNTQDGKAALVRVSNEETEEGSTFPALSIDDLAIRFQRITVMREAVKRDSAEFQKLRVVNEQIRFIKQFMKYLGTPASPKQVNTLPGSFLEVNMLKPNRQQVFYRDVGIIARNDNTQSNYNALGELVKNAITKYKELKETYQQDFFEQGFVDEKDIQFDYKLENVKTNFNKIEETLTEVNRLMLENEDFLKISATTADFTGRTANNWKLDSGFYVINLSNTRKNLKTKLDVLDEYKKKIQEEIQNKVNREIVDILGFQPNIRNIMGILCNNIEMFLKLIYDVGKNAEEKNGRGTNTNDVSNVSQRLLELGGYITDSVEGDQKVYPFPKLVDQNYKEVYLGKILENRDKSFFPEIKFIENLCEGLTYSIKQNQKINESFKNTAKIVTLEPFPINPYDIGTLPYVGLENLPSELPGGTLNKEVVTRIVRRGFISYAMSKYKNDNGNLATIGELEGITYFESLSSLEARSIINELPAEQNDINSLQQLAVTYGVATIVGDRFKFETSLYTKSFDIDKVGTVNSGTRLWDRSVNLKDKLKEPLKLNGDNNPNNPQNTSTVIPLFTSKLRTNEYVNRYFDTTKTLVNKSYLTLETFVSDGLKNSMRSNGSIDNANLFEKYSFNSLMTINIGNGAQYFYAEYTPTQTFQNGVRIYFTKSKIYQNTNNDAGKAYLILSSLFFNSDLVLDNEIGDDYSKIIRLPYFYLLWLGANSYRLNNGEILSFDTVDYPAVPLNQFFYVTQQSHKVPIENTTLISRFENLFVDWVNGGEFNDLKDKMEELFGDTNLTVGKKKDLIDKIDRLILREYDLVVYDSTWLRKGDSAKDETITIDALSQYLNRFMTGFKKTFTNVYPGQSGNPNKPLPEPPEEKSPVVDEDIKSAFYLDLKQVYDNWIAGNTSHKSFSCCGSNKPELLNQKVKLFDLFKFVDKFRNTIAGDAIININSFTDLVGKRDMGLYSFISKVLTDSYFMHFNLPIFLEFNNTEQVKQVFEPQLVFNSENMKNSPSFLCVYNGPPSSSLNSNSNYGDDSFKFNDKPLPKAVVNKKVGEKNPHLVAFNVNYGSQTQSIFKNISVNTQESKMTGEYITALSNYVLGTGESKPILKDNSIYPMLRNRSYTANIQMMGDMMIQPQMYFQLNNIPFFSGAYMIMNVNHRIGANNMLTSFKGVRQNRSPVTIVTEAISFLSFQYDGLIYSASPFTTISATTEETPKDKQMGNTTALLPDNIVTNYTPTSGSAILRAIGGTGAEIHQGLDLKVESNELVQTVNKKGTILYNVPGDPTVKGKLIIEHTPDVNGDGYYYYTGYFGISGNNTFPDGQPIAPNTSIGKGTLFNAKGYPETYFYHFEVKRSKEQLKSYKEYSTSNSVEAIQIPTTEKLPLKLYSIALHGNELF